LPKKERVITLRISENEKVSIPKKTLYSLFSYASKEDLDDLVNDWAIEQKHVVRLIWGELNLQSLLDVIFKMSKYMMGTDARVIKASNLAKGASYDEMKDPSTIFNYSDGVSGAVNTSDTFWIVIRHNLGVNCS
jgi:hypothetical protein